LPRHHRGPPRSPPRREPAGPGFDVHHHTTGVPVAGSQPVDRSNRRGVRFQSRLVAVRFNTRTGDRVMLYCALGRVSRRRPFASILNARKRLSAVEGEPEAIIESLESVRPESKLERSDAIARLSPNPALSPMAGGSLH